MDVPFKFNNTLQKQMMYMYTLGFLTFTILFHSIIVYNSYHIVGVIQFYFVNLSVRYGVMVAGWSPNLDISFSHGSVFPLLTLQLLVICNNARCNWIREGKCPTLCTKIFIIHLLCQVYMYVQSIHILTVLANYNKISQTCKI